MDPDQAVSELYAAASAAIDAMVKAENSLLAYGDIEGANVLSGARARLEDAGRGVSTGNVSRSE